MARTTAARITDWGTPPEPEPTGWDAIRAELAKRPGEWANIGEYSTASARKISKERVPESEGYETRIVPAPNAEGRSIVWVRLAAAPGTAAATPARPGVPRVGG